MAGYNWEAGMSNNAVDAYDRGLFPLSKLSAALLKSNGIGITVGFARYLADNYAWSSSEWHHSGGDYFNEVKFYDLTDLQEFLTNSPDKVAEHLADYNESRKVQRERKQQEKGAPPRKVNGYYYSWTGGWRGKRRKRETIVFTGTKQGCWILIDNSGKKKSARSKNIYWAYADGRVPA